MTDMTSEGTADVKVTLIDCTGMGHPDPHRAARVLVIAKSTRLDQSASTRAAIDSMDLSALLEALSYAANTIRSAWEFVDYTFQVTDVTRAFTHQLVRTRTASYAQQAQRVVDMGAFQTAMPETVSSDPVAAAIWASAMGEVAAAYSRLKNECAIPTQDARGVLPTNILTNIMVKMNLRTFADLVGKRENLRAQGEYADVMRLMASEVLAVHPWVRPFLYPERLSTPELDAMLKGALGSAGPLDKPAVNAALKELDKLKGTWG